MPTLRVRASFYRQFDADPARDVPGEGFAGWETAEIPLAPERTALVSMHAWDTGDSQRYPGWHRCVEYFPRADAILREVHPPLLAAARAGGLRVYHVASDEAYCGAYPGYARARALAGTPVAPAPIPSDPTLDELRRFRRERSGVGAHNLADVERGFAAMRDFPPQARPVGDEGVAVDTAQLAALCRADGVNHLVYIGFAIDWCLLMSPGGMNGIRELGVMCSTVGDAVTAVENRDSARAESHKEVGLWRVGMAFGFVFQSRDLIAALTRPR